MLQRLVLRLQNVVLVLQTAGDVRDVGQRVISGGELLTFFSAVSGSWVGSASAVGRRIA